VDLLEPSVVRAYVNDLRALLSKGSIVEQKSFLRSFVKRIEANLPQVVITYTLPLKTQQVGPLKREVLPFAYAGSLIVSSCHDQDNLKMPRADAAGQGVNRAPIPTLAPDQSGVCGAVSCPAHRGIAVL
jgi:hypothetical protein